MTNMLLCCDPYWYAEHKEGFWLSVIGGFYVIAVITYFSIGIIYLSWLSMKPGMMILGIFAAIVIPSTWIFRRFLLKWVDKRDRRGYTSHVERDQSNDMNGSDSGTSTSSQISYQAASQPRSRSRNAHPRKSAHSSPSGKVVYSDSIWTKKDYITGALLLLVVGMIYLLVAGLEYTFHPIYRQEVENVHFLRLGSVAENQGKVSYRIPEPPNDPFFWIQYRAFQEDASAESNWIDVEPRRQLLPQNDWVDTVTISDLDPSTVYQYRLMESATENGVGTSRISYHDPAMTERELEKVEELDPRRRSLLYSFKTFPESNSTQGFTFVYGSCIKPFYPYGSFGVRGMHTLNKLNADFMIFLGDFIYVDSPYYFGDNIEDYRRQYRFTIEASPMRTVLAKTPGFYTYDDHEIVNNWDKPQSVSPFPVSKQAFETYLANTNPIYQRVEDVLYYTFNYGEVASYFVTDTRRYRAPDRESMLGETQREELFNFLQNAPGVWKFVATSVPFTQNWGGLDKDTWAAYGRERRLILEYIRDNAIRNVVFLSGDRHETGITRIATSDPPRFDLMSPLPEDPGNSTMVSDENAIIEFSTSPVNQFYFGLVPIYKEREGDQKIFYEPVGAIKVGWLRVNIDELEYRMYWEDKERFRLKLTAI